MNRMPYFNLLAACIGFVGFIGLSTDVLKAQSPSSISGVAVTMTITSGSYPFSSSGSFRFLASATDNTFGSVAISGPVGDTYGTFTYGKTGANTATVNYDDAILGNGFM